MGIISWIIVGGLAGWIASMIMKSDGRMGLLANIIVGIVGGLLGGFVLSLFNIGGVNGFSIWSILVSVLGAVILLWIINLIRRR